jgi:hypothetical protein
MNYIEPQIRNILKCDFVDRLIISNHNPEIKIEAKVKTRDNRIVILNQDISRGCGYRWKVASWFDPEYLIVIDDDLFLFSWQLAKLFTHLVIRPELPHGLAGFLRVNNTSFEYHEREDIALDYLCEVYAVTGNHLRRYHELEQLVGRKNGNVVDLIQSATDFMIISQTGRNKPLIHNVGRLLRNPTFKKPGVAVHKEKNFAESMLQVDCELNNLKINVPE